VDSALLNAWRTRAGVPDDQVEEWFRTGAPAGLSANPLPRGIFPPATEAEGLEEFCLESLISDPESFLNSHGIDDDEHALAEIQGLRGQGLIEDYESVVEQVQAKPSLSKVGVLEKISSGKVKRRVIVDSKRSGVSPATTKLERIVLPRVLDAVYDALHQMAEARRRGDTSCVTEFFVLDFANAFFVVPFCPRRAQVLCHQIGLQVLRAQSAGTRRRPEPFDFGEGGRIDIEAHSGHFLPKRGAAADVCG
jgi:hypothetical protein